MATEDAGTQAGPAAAAAAPAAQLARPQLSPEEQAARGEAPVKAEFLRATTCHVHVGAVTGGQIGAAAAAVGQGQPAPAAAAAEAAAGATAGEGQRQRDVQSKSKKKAKKERSQQRFSSAELCTAFALGRCPFGDGCRFNHDVDAYLRSKPAELPGTCPFNAAERCPYGITCRWASTHAHPDELVQRHILDGKQPQQGQEQGQEPAARAAPAAEGAAPAAAAAAGEAGEQQQGEAGAPAGGAQGWWRRDGTIPGGVVELQAGAAPPLDPLNTLSKEVQTQLRKGGYSFQAADAVLASMGITFHRDRGGRGGRGGGRGGRGGGRGGRGGSPATGPAQVPAGAPPPDGGGPQAGAEAPAPKRAKLEPGGRGGGGGGGEGVEGAAPMAVDEAPKEPAGTAAAAGAAAAPAAAAGDAVFVGSLGAAVADAAAGAAGGGGGGDAGYVEARPHPREKRSVDFRGKTFLAPLTTAGNLPFRRVCKGLGADVTCGEMALATNLLQGQPSEWALLKRHPSEDCFGVQLCGGYADSLARCAQLVEEQCCVDFVDVNFGCPIDVVCSKGAGSACLLKPQRMQAIVRGMSSVLSCPVTFKSRKGYHDGQDMAHTLIPQAAGWGAAAVTLHGRTREQRYSRLADWPYIKRCVEAAEGTGLQVVGNGDVFSFEDHYRHLEECPGLATTYIARGALIKPWIFTEIKERRHWDISAGERLDMFKRFCSNGLEHWGSDSRGVETTRRFLLEWLSFTHRYIPVGLLEVVPQRMHWRPPAFVGRSDLETLLASDNAADWVAVSEMLLGPAPPGFVFSPKHKANSYARREASDLAAAAGAAPAPSAAGPAPGGGAVPAGAATVAAAGEEEEY